MFNHRLGFSIVCILSVASTCLMAEEGKPVSQAATALPKKATRDIPPIDAAAPKKFETATFALG